MTTTVSNNTREKIDANVIIFMTFTIFICSWYIMPDIKKNLSYPKFSIILIIYSFLYILPSQEKLRIISNIFLWSILLALVHTLVAYPGNIKKGFWILMTEYITFIPFLIFISVFKRRNNIEYIILTASILIMIVISGLKTYFMMQTVPNIARYMTSISTSNHVQLGLYQSENIGGFGLSYSIGLLTVISFSIYLHIEKSRVGYIPLIFSIFGVIYVVKAQFALLLLSTMISIAYTIFRKIRRSPIKLIFYIIFPLFLFTIPWIFSFLGTFFDGTIVGSKLILMQSSSILNYDRIKMYFSSFSLFLRSPIWGNNITGSNYITYVSSHGTFFSLLCSTGILGVSFYIGQFTAVHHILKRRFSSKLYKDVFYPSYFFLLVTFITNPTYETFELYIVLFLLVPSAMMYILNNSYKNHRYVFKLEI